MGADKSVYNAGGQARVSLGQEVSTILDTIQDFICILDKNKKIIYGNQVFINQLGFSPSELSQKTIFDLHKPADLEESKKVYLQLEHDCEITYSLPFVCKNGDEILVETKVTKGEWHGEEAIFGTSRDITERINYEQQLRQNTERLEMTLLSSNAGLWDWNVKENLLVLNEKWHSMRGYDTSDIRPSYQSWQDLLHPEDMEATLQNLNDHLSGKTSFFQAEYRTKTKTGEYFWILDTGKIAEYDEKGSPVRIVGTNIDITPQKENELKLQKNLRQQELLSEIALELNSLEDFDKRINNVLSRIGIHTNVSRVYIFEDINQGLSTCNTFEWCNRGITAQMMELQDIPYEMMPSWKKFLLEQGRVYSENVEELPDDIRAILEPQEIKSIIVYPLYVQGLFFGFIGFDECTRNKHWTKSELELLRTVSGIIANTYERRNYEKSLKESEAKNRAILESIPDIIFQFNKDGLILSYRSSSTEDLALSPELFINKRIQEVFPGDFSDLVAEAISTCLQNGSCRIDYMLPVKGVLQDYEARLSKMNENEVIALVRNVSERKNYERQLTEERDKANLANKAKSEFLANMSHEIRTPMNAILGFSEALYHKLDSEQYKKMVKSILSSGNLLLTLLNDILDLSKIEAGMLEISKQPVDFVNIIREIKMLFLSKAEKKNIEINIRSSDNFPELLMLDEIRIKQVIFNIIGNAIKFTHAGSVNIRVNFESTMEKFGVLTIEVQDTGIGIPLSQQEAIFEPFRQQFGQSNRFYEGAGLGLAISRRLVEKMKGFISLESQVGKGSNFIITIPCTEVVINEKQKVDQVRENTDVVFEPAEILIVDDVKLNLETLENLLDGSGLTVSMATDADVALEILKRKAPSIILVDLKMPKMDGYEFARIIKSIPHLKNIPLISFTAFVFGSAEIENSNLFDGFLYKPVRRNDLYLELMKYLEYHPKTELNSSVLGELSLDELSEEQMQKLPFIYDSIVDELIPKWESVKDQLILFKIEEFAKELEELAVKFEFGYLIRYAQKIKTELETVDLESMQSTLKLFPDIVTKISNLIQ